MVDFSVFMLVLAIGVNVCHMDSVQLHLIIFVLHVCIHHLPDPLGLPVTLFASSCVFEILDLEFLPTKFRIHSFSRKLISYVN